MKTTLRITPQIALRTARVIGHDDIIACPEMSIADIDYWLVSGISHGAATLNPSSRT
jgi:hypothetical protein